MWFVACQCYSVVVFLLCTRVLEFMHSVTPTEFCTFLASKKAKEDSELASLQMWSAWGCKAFRILIGPFHSNVHFLASDDHLSPSSLHYLHRFSSLAYSHLYLSDIHFAFLTDLFPNEWVNEKPDYFVCSHLQLFPRTRALVDVSPGAFALFRTVFRSNTRVVLLLPLSTLGDE